MRWSTGTNSRGLSCVRRALVAGILALGASACRDAPPEPASRPTLGRLSTATRYAPYDATPTSPSRPGAAGRELAAALRWGQLDLALRLAERAPAGSAASHNDLAVVLLEQSVREGATLAALRALEEAGRAVAREPGRPEFLFNLALARSNAGLQLRARELWLDLVGREADSRWADEARAWLAENRRPSRSEEWRRIVAELDRADGDEIALPQIQGYPFQARRYAERELIGQWAEAASTGSERAHTLWRRLQEIARFLAEERGEGLISDALAALDPAAAAAPALLAAHRDLSAGLQEFHAGAHDRARSLLHRSAAALAEIDTPLAALAELFRILAEHERDHRRAADRLAALEDRIDARRYPSLAGRIAWWRGILASRAGRHEQALGHYQRGTEAMQRSSGPDGAQFGHVLLAEDLAALGDRSAALRHHLIALRELTVLGERRGRHSTLIALAETLLRYGRGELASEYAREAVLNAAAWGAPIGRLEASLERARAARALGLAPEVSQALRIATEQLGSLGDDLLRASRELELHLEQGWVDADERPAEALAKIRQAAAGLRALGKRRFDIPALVAEAAIHRHAGDRDAERTALEAAVARYEEIRRQVAAPGLRSLAFYQAQTAVDRLTRLALLDPEGAELDGAARALLLSDRGRARFLLDLRMQLPQEAAGADLLARAKAALGEPTMLVELAVLGDEVWAWKLTADRLETLRLETPADELEGLAERLIAGLQPPVTEAPEGDPAGRLYDALIRPLALPSEIERLVLVPDRFLRQLPFAALWNRERGRYLVEEVSLAESPSLALWLAGQGRRPSDRAPAERRALVVGNSLDRLPHAAREAREVAAVYPAATLLIDRQATENRLLAELPRHQVLHVAAHATANPEATHRSRLYLAPDGDDPGELTAAELFDRNLAGYSLVVLSACGTTRGFDVDREGFSGLAGAFLARGAGAVVATRWEIDDRQAARLLPAFHRRYLEHGDPSRALREAQTQLIHQTDSDPADWAAFVVLGG